MTDNLLDGRDIIDSREINERIVYLSTVFDEYDDERDELAALVAFRDEMSDYLPDWEYGETLIRDSYFVEYAQELAEDIGAVSSDSSWPNGYIDWERAARDLRMDYTSGDLNGVTYWGRM